MTVSTPDIQALIEEARAKIEVAHTELIRILSVNEQTRMSIPANPSRDTDLIIVAALDAGRDLAAALSALSGEMETEWAARVTPAESDYGEAVYYEYPDRLSVKRFIKTPPLWYSLRLGETKEVVSRRKAGPWIEVTK